MHYSFNFSQCELITHRLYLFSKDDEQLRPNNLDNDVTTVMMGYRLAVDRVELPLHDDEKLSRSGELESS
jgi:hypothetical protein